MLEIGCLESASKQNTNDNDDEIFFANLLYFFNSFSLSHLEDRIFHFKNRV